MIGTAAGSMVSTVELEKDMVVSVDGEQYTVEGWAFKDHDTNDMVVTLVCQFGPDWELEVRAGDAEEPMWELV